MKPTVKSIQNAQRNVDDLINKLLAVSRCLYAANLLFRCGDVRDAKEQLELAKQGLKVRATLTAAIVNTTDADVSAMNDNLNP